MRKAKVMLTFQQRYKLGKWLEELGQDAIDKGNLSFVKLAKLATKKMEFEVTVGHVKKLLPEVGLRACQEMLDRAHNANKKNAGIPVGTEREEFGRWLEESRKVQNDLVAAVRMLVEFLERQVQEQEWEADYRRLKKEELDRETGDLSNPER